MDGWYRPETFPLSSGGAPTPRRRTGPTDTNPDGGPHAGTDQPAHTTLGDGGMRNHVLITGGAGFIGSHLADALLARGHTVRALDNLSPQVHGENSGRPTYLHEDIELIRGDVRDPNAVQRALKGIDVVYHLAAAVGVGQSMYEIAQYTSVNNLGTAVLLEALAAEPVSRLIVASSMSLYGEGLYRCPNGSTCVGVERVLPQLRAGEWEVRNERGEILTPV